MFEWEKKSNFEQVVGGVFYSTVDANLIGEAWANSLLPGDDWRNAIEKLYVSQNGRYFLVIFRGEAWKIRPVSKSDALTWAEDKRLSPDVISRFFTIRAA